MSIQRLVILSVLLVVVLTAAQLGAADSEVSGIFKGNDQPAKLAFVSAHKGTPVSGKETIKLVFTEKDHFNQGACGWAHESDHCGKKRFVSPQISGTPIPSQIPEGQSASCPEGDTARRGCRKSA
jgi:hypothetical protein